jgi:S1-C subfamily serine protease
MTVSSVERRRLFERAWIVPGVVVVLVALIAGGVGWLLGRSSAPPAATSAFDASTAEAARTTTDPLYAAPENLRELIAQAKAFTVEVFCGDGGGAGWIIDTAVEPLVRTRFSSEYGSDFPQTVVTAEHVIRECRQGESPVEVWIGRKQVEAVLMNWDRKRDVATIGIATDGRAAALPYTVTPDGSWAMTVGAPLDDGVVPVIGQVVRDDGVDLLMHLTVRPGNSGGPVVNARGEVVGTLGGTLLDDETESAIGWSYAAPVEALCERLFECSVMGIDE